MRTKDPLEGTGLVNETYRELYEDKLEAKRSLGAAYIEGYMNGLTSLLADGEAGPEGDTALLRNGLRTHAPPGARGRICQRGVRGRNASDRPDGRRETSARAVTNRPAARRPPFT
jgi:hypothetical protein